MVMKQLFKILLFIFLTFFVKGEKGFFENLLRVDESPVGGKLKRNYHKRLNYKKRNSQKS